MPVVSVVMPVYNSEQFLAEAIESILAQTFTDFELIIVDDGSEDNSAAIIRSRAEREPRIQFLQLAENMGVANARNAGLARARGEYIATMDADDVCLPERLRTQIDFLESQPDIGVVGCNLQVSDQHLNPIGSYDYQQKHALIIYEFLIARGSGFGHPSTIIRRALLDECGGYQPNLQIAVEMDLWIRLASRTRFANLPEVLVVHRRHERALGVAQRTLQRNTSQAFREIALRAIWPDAPDAAINRLLSVGEKTSWNEFIAVKRDLKRLIEKLLDSNWIKPADRQMLHEEIDRRIQIEFPYLYRKLRQWFRYRIGRHLSAMWR